MILVKISSFNVCDEWLSLLHNFIQQSQNVGSPEVQTLPEACRKYPMVRNLDNGPNGNKSSRTFISQLLHKNNPSLSSFQDVYDKTKCDVIDSSSIKLE